MYRITKVDAALARHMKDITAFAKEIEIPLVCSLKDEKAISQIREAGIYLIEIRTKGHARNWTDWIGAFRAEWNHKKFSRKHTPSLKEKRAASHKALMEWMPLYLGKSKVIGNRVLQHLNFPMGKQTFSLKLKARGAMPKYQFRLRALRVGVKHYDLIVPTLESKFRERFNPLVGRQ